VIGSVKILFATLLGLLLFSGTAPLPSQEKSKEKKPAVLILKVPADAKLEVDGVPTKQTGETRRFESPPLPPGTYTYTIKVLLPTGGAEQTRMRQVRVEAGKEVEVDLRPGKDKDSSEIIFVPTPQSVVEKMLEFAKVTKDDLVYDLGCGDGRIVVTAAKKYGARGVGVDIDPVRVKEAQALAKKEGVEKLVEIRLGDALNVPDIGNATVVMTYMLPEFMARMEPGLKKNLKPGTRVVAHDYPLPNWKATEEKTVQSENWEHRLYLWRVGK
jgi:uncharacterized protein (TIGR03000 family)